ncbi:hypothetical protein ACFRAU_07155 [Arthrobacter sp. NPDC056691]|uniref:hypothetical protein n=1 Tax=Arthrobacter sp. NPDC056691 TaxID=3345913 RepID=UPI0036706A7E
MTTTTPNKTLKTDTAQPAGARLRRPTIQPAAEDAWRNLRAALQRLTPVRGGQAGIGLAVWTGFFRAVVLFADYVLAMLTAIVVIPMLGAWMHTESGASRGGLSGDGTVAMWLVPLLFLVALLAAGEIVLMRAMWRWGTQRIEAIRNARAASALHSGHAPKTRNRSRKNPRRSK